MNWYIKLLFAAGGYTTWMGPNPRSGGDTFWISGDTFPIRQQLKDIGFNWDGTRKAWYHWKLDVLLRNQAGLTTLRNLGVDTSPLSGTPSRPPQAPTPRQPATPPPPTQQQAVPPAEQQEALKQQTQETPQQQRHIWILAKALNLYALAPNDPVVVTVLPPKSQEEGKRYLWMDEEGNQGEVPENEAKMTFATVKQPDGKLYQGADDKKLFEIFYQLFPKDKNFQPSKYQQDILNTFSSTKNNMMIDALAGSGKTTSLKQIAKMMKPGEKWLYLVFNRRNMIEASQGAKKFPEGVTVLTSHSFLGSVLQKASSNNILPDTKLWEDKGDEETGRAKNSERIDHIIDSVMEVDQTFPYTVKWPASKCIAEIVKKCKAEGINPTVPNIAEQVAATIKKYYIDTDLSTENFNTDRDWTPQLIQKSVEVLHMSMPGAIDDPHLETMRDHDDTLWYAALNADRIPWPKYDVVLVDEVQDFNRCQIIMLTQLKKRGARMIAVGDVNQALYMFRGADPNSFQEIKNLMTEGGMGSEHSLPTNYRSGTDIIKYVNEHTHVKNLQAGRQHRGLVTENTPYEHAMSGIENEWAANGRKLRMPTTVLSYANRPLAETAMSLIQKDIDFELLGTEVGKELKNHVKLVAPPKGKRQKIVPIGQLATYLTSWATDLESRWRGKISKTKRLQEIKDRTEALTAIITHLAKNNYFDPRLRMQVTNSVDFMDYIGRRFKGVNTENAAEMAKLAQRDPRTYVMLSTSHKSKGSEFDRVYIAEPGSFSPKEKDTPLSIAQKRNAWYVALTRAMKELHVLEDKPKDNDDEF